MAMRFGAAFWVQRTGWPELRDAVLHAEAAGFDDLWVDDHLLSDEGDWTDGKLEGWTTLAALAAVTTRARLGHMVTANTFRNPGLVAKMAATVDHVSDGRVILGLGAGWFEREHDAFGLKFGPWMGERIDRLGEATGVIRRLLDGERVTHEGPHYRLHDAVCAPRPVQARLPILLGGAGPKKTLPLVARHADLWNLYGSPEKAADADAVLREACAAIGRDERRDRADGQRERRRARLPGRGGGGVGGLGPAPPADRHREGAERRRHDRGGRGAAPPVPRHRLPPPGPGLPDAVRPRDDGPPAEAAGL